MKVTDRDPDFWGKYESLVRERERLIDEGIPASELATPERPAPRETLLDRRTLAKRIADYNETRDTELRLRRTVTIAGWLVAAIFLGIFVALLLSNG
jgi:hypothetical protein